MKFNEKLIDLRKKAGLSQEELGYKLNVTRQTVSKWELGQTTPEMDKLVEISKIFNISVDNLINETESTSNENPIIPDQTIEDKTIEKKEPKNNKIIIVIIALIIVVAIIIIKGFTSFRILNNVNNGINSVTNEQESILDRFFNLFDNFFDLFDKAIDTQKDMIEMDESKEMNSIIENSENIIGNILSEMDNSNKKDNIIGNSENIIGNIVSEMDDSNKKDNIIANSQNIIGNTLSEMEKTKFNSSFEIYSGTKMGGHVIALLDHTITSNKTKEQKITVKYNQTESQDETEIKNIKQQIDTFKNYEVTFEYDADGFINKVTIQKI